MFANLGTCDRVFSERSTAQQEAGAEWFERKSVVSSWVGDFFGCKGTML